jgi:pimeloyl-ACP methyl ester carboxylesterase
VIGNQPFLLVAHSYGSYLAQAIATQRPAQAAGVALVCPVMSMGEDNERALPEHTVVYTEGKIEGVLSPEDEAEYRNYFVVQTPETLKRYQETVASGVALADHAALERIFTQWELDPAPTNAAPYPHPALILLGRHDSTVGYADQWQLVEQYPRATFAILDGAGHALPHEQMPLVAALMTEWLTRVANSRP